MSIKSAIKAGNPEPLGATWDGKGVNFALFSEHAEKVELCLFNSSGDKEITRLRLPEKTGHIWHGYVTELEPGDLYGYRVYGPYLPEQGHRFNQHKLLVDPYTKLLQTSVTRHRSQLAYDPSSNEQDLSFCTIDSAPDVPKSVITEVSPEYAEDLRPKIAWSDTILYESHIRGFTIANPDIPEALRGTFSGMAHSRVIDYLKDLGITSIELLPVHGFTNENFLQHKGLSNYWGYNSLTFFAPEPRYANANALNEFQAMVCTYHDAGIEVILDVVYNHTAEGDHLGPTLSFRGIDNASYYRLNSDNPRFYINDTGCGNTLNITHPQVRTLVLDSLRYWVSTMGVDGFRFDLAPALAREEQGYSTQSEFFKEISRDPILSNTKRIAEPWDIGPGGYQLGNFPDEWSEWNDRFRDSCRKFWRGDQSMAPEMVKRLHGSADLFQNRGRQPRNSVNFIAAHDGFTLNDVVSYNHRHNDQNLEDNRDGHGANYSANYGVEGYTEDCGILKLRRRQQRNMLATTLLSQGTPMLLAGDEFSNSQQGNNNAYCQDNKISWLCWDHEPAQKAMIEFTTHLIQLRKCHKLLRWESYLHSEDFINGAKIQWLNEAGLPITVEQWHNPDYGFLGCLLSLGPGYPSMENIGAKEILLLLNRTERNLQFRLPANPDLHAWVMILDTNSENGISDSMAQAYDQVRSTGLSVMMLAGIAKK